MSRLGHDFRLAVRGLLGAKGPVGFAIVTLALGIGVTSAVFSILDAVLLRPVPFAHADRLADVLNFETKSQVSHPGFPPKLLAEWRKQTDLFERVEAYDVSSSIYDATAGAEMVTGATVTPGLLAMLGVAPAKGRLLGEGDGRGGTDDRLVISDAFWRTTFGHDPQIIGRTLTLDGRTHTIVGVMPSTFRFPNEAILYWRPYDPEAPPARTREPNLGAMVRLRPDVPPAIAAERVKARGQQLNVATGRPRRSGGDAANGRRVDRPQDAAVATGSRRRRWFSPAHRVRESREPLALAHAGPRPRFCRTVVAGRLAWRFVT
jgi:hypothetical protein